jgi:hypothetical protein
MTSASTARHTIAAANFTAESSHTSGFNASLETDPGTCAASPKRRKTALGREFVRVGLAAPRRGKG